MEKERVNRKIKAGFISTIVVFSILAVFSVGNIGAASPVSITYKFESPTIEKIGEFDKITIKGLENLDLPDKPILPCKIAKVLIPYGHEIQDISVETGEEVSLGTGFNVEIGKYPTVTGEEDSSSSQYNFEGQYPDSSFEFLRIQFHRGYKVAYVRLFPVMYNGTSGELSYLREITLNITTAPIHDYEPEITFRGTEEDRNEVLSIVDNPWTIDTYISMQKSIGLAQLPPGGPYDYVIITDTTLQPIFQNLANWKNSRGISATIVTTTYIYSHYSGSRPDGGTDNATRIRNFIIDAYNNWHITYVLLGGDVEIIPHRGVYGYVSTTSGPVTDTNIPCDLYYAGLDGNWDTDGDGIYGEGSGIGGGSAGEEADFTYEVYVGRAPVSNTTEATNFVNKTIAFESSTVPKKASMWGAKLWDSPITWGGSHKDLIIPYFPGTYTISTYYDRDSTASTANWVASVNNGQNFVNYGGHGNVNSMNGHLTRSQVDSQITNTSNFCLVYSWGCYNGSFDNRNPNGSYDTNDCIGEHFVNNSTGAFAFIGNSRYGFFSIGSTNGPSHQFDKAFFDAIFNKHILNAGKALADSKSSLHTNVEPTRGPYRWIYFELNLLGDPETPLLGVSNATLSSSISASPSPVSSGDTVTVTMIVQNTSGTQANNVTPSSLTVNTTGTASATLLSGPSPASANIPAGGSQNFTWTYIANSGANGGTISFMGYASGTDAGTGNPVFSPATTSNTVTVQAPASLSSSISADPTPVSSGQQVTVTMNVQNTGGTAANNVIPSTLTVNTTGTASATLLSGPNPASANIPAGSSQNFTWTYIANSGANGGTISFTGNASGTDAGTGNPVSSSVTTSNVVTVQVPASINANLTTNLAVVSDGQNVTVNMIVSNTGQATANNVTPSALTLSTTGTASATYSSGPAPPSANITGGNSQTFTWIYTCNSGANGGTVTFSGNSTGTDANSGNPLTSNTDSATVTVETPANLVSSITATPAFVAPGQEITVTMTVQNIGQADALNVVPSALVIAGTGTVTLTSGPNPATVNIPGLSSQTFTWTYEAGDVGDVTFSGNASGTDENSGIVVSSPITDSNTVTIALNANPIAAFRPIAMYHLRQVNTCLECITDNLPEDVPEDVQNLLDEMQEHINNANTTGNSIYANNELLKALKCAEDIQEKLGITCPL